MKTLLLLLSGLAALSVGSVAQGFSGHGGANHRTPAVSSSISGSVIDVQSHASKLAFELRLTDGRLRNIALNRNSRITTSHGSLLSGSDIRLGDHLTVRGTASIQDTSQTLVHLRGIVSDAPLVATNPMTVQIGPGWSIIVDTQAQTRYTDTSHETSNVAEIQDSDEVQLQGIYDNSVSEMTQTMSIDRTGPFHRKKGQASKK